MNVFFLVGGLVCKAGIAYIEQLQCESSLSC